MRDAAIREARARVVGADGAVLRPPELAPLAPSAEPLPSCASSVPMTSSKSEGSVVETAQRSTSPLRRSSAKTVLRLRIVTTSAPVPSSATLTALTW